MKKYIGLITGSTMVAGSFVLAAVLGVFAPFCILTAGILACTLPFIRQAGEDAKLEELKERGILK